MAQEGHPIAQEGYPMAQEGRHSLTCAAIVRIISAVASGGMSVPAVSGRVSGVSAVSSPSSRGPPASRSGEPPPPWPPESRPPGGGRAQCGGFQMTTAPHPGTEYEDEVEVEVEVEVALLLWSPAEAV
eukprot:1170279-Prorocentrum_minimum.AAC.1